ncbi:MAG: sulfatase-like hydrolase/transferase [Nitrosomonas sp.]|nr:sulfatase-like hydrolase/transferase [Nitrosomonas sp.]
MFVKLVLLLVIPVAVSFYYSAERDPFWLCMSIAALAITLYALMNIIGTMTHKPARRMLGSVLVFPLAFFELSRSASFYFQGESFNERFFFHFNWSSITEAGGAYLPVIGAVLVYFAVIAILCWTGFGRNFQNKNYPVAVQLFFLVFALFVLEPDISEFSARQIRMMLHEDRSQVTDPVALRTLALNPEALSTEIGLVVPGKNVLLIYLESLEEIYTDERIFPGLTPFLNRLKQSGLTFRHMHQTEGTGWTVAGMFASQCGTPLLDGYGSGGNNMLQTGFLNRAICLGDILKQAGYYQVYLGGASTQFAGKGHFLDSHGYDEVLGNAELTSLLEDRTYLSGWGLYDDSLFAIAEEKFKLLAQSHRPFNLTLLTLDTHHPDGHASRTCPGYRFYENTMLDAIHCTDFLLNQFLASIRQHPAWENTLVVLFSDHLAMRNVAQQYYPSGYERKLLFVILNAGARGEIAIPGTHMDVAPTVLHAMDVRHERAFLAGNNLLKADQSVSVDSVFSRDRLDALRYINRHMLTHTENDFCSSDHLIDIQDNVIKIGDRAITMNLAGYPLAPETLGFSHGMLIVFDRQGEIESTVLFNLENLSHIIYQYIEAPFLLVAGADYLPQRLKAGMAQQEGIAVLWKNPQGKMNYLGGGNDPARLKIKHPGCSNLFPKIGRKVEENANIFGLQDICRVKKFDKNYVDAKTGSIHLVRVAHKNTWYRAVLLQTDTNRYGIADLVIQGEIVPSSESGRCHAYFNNSELIIPALKSEGQLHAVKMQLIPGADIRFRMIEKVRLQ